MAEREWQISFSAYFVNVFYLSSLNDTYWEKPEVQEVDICGPPNLISSGYALWLILVPAVACVIQLPGSVTLYQRSNFYRFAPELGLADCLATICLLVKLLWKGYRWNESVAAVFMVREGIGRGELWWRETVEQESTRGAHIRVEEIDATIAVENADLFSSPEATHGESQFRSRLKPYSEPISLERVIGAALFVISFTKTVTLFTAASQNPAVRTTCMVALAYSLSFIIFEVLVWSLALSGQGYSLEDIPDENLLALLRYVDPGNNPFTFPSPPGPASERSPNSAIELGSVSSQFQRGRMPHPTIVPWNKAVALSAASLGILGPLMWIFILTTIWKPSKSVFLVTITALTFLCFRILVKVLRHYLSAVLTLITIPLWLQQLRKSISELALTLEKRSQSEPSLFLVRWTWERATTINFFSAVWVLVIGIYCVRLFPGHSLEGIGEPAAKPMWLDWLG